MALEIIRGWKGYTAFDTEQQHQVGLVTTSPDGDRASYVQLTPGSYDAGEVLRDFAPADLVTGATGTPQSAKQGDTILKDSGEFTNDDFIGALGVITAGGAVGDTFVVTQMIDADTIAVRRLTSPADTSVGWSADFTGTTRYQLFFPGRCALATGANQSPRGVLQTDVEVPAGEFRYGWVRQSGIGVGRVDVSGGVLAPGSIVVPVAGGLVAGPSATPTVAQVNAKIGRALTGEPAADGLTLIDWDIVNTAISGLKADREYAFSRVDV